MFVTVFSDEAVSVYRCWNYSLLLKILSMFDVQTKPTTINRPMNMDPVLFY